MKPVTVVLQLLFTVVFVVMCWLVYNQLSGQWRWDVPYTFIATVFRLLSLLFFVLVFVLVSGLAAFFASGTALDNIVVGLYNVLVLRMWYMQPYGLDGPLTNVYQVFGQLAQNFSVLGASLYDQSFTFMYFLFAGIGVAMFLQSVFRMQHKFVVGSFVSIQLIMVVAAFREIAIYDYAVFPGSFAEFITSGLQILVLLSWAYLEIGYQMIYSHSVAKPVEERENTLKKQLLALRNATRKQDAIERGEAAASSAMSRATGATAFSFLREAIERRILGSKDGLEKLDAVSDVRRLQIFVDELLSMDPKAKDELTARAAAPSSKYVLVSTVLGSSIRFLAVVSLSFLLMSPGLLVSVLSLPPGIAQSLELVQPEFVMLLLVPVVLMFPFTAMLISMLSNRNMEEKPKLTKEEKELERRRKKELAERKRAAARARRERERARRKKAAGAEEKDEWDRALEETFRR
ncbi:MAG: hypothetical protein HXY34_02375 [Candidatus Thorarchaeota archaeon]|nr:hypothetical protein [Candidatus Thorarchaeota archaeon]